MIISTTKAVRVNTSTHGASALWALLLFCLFSSADAAITCSINTPTALNFVYVSGTDATSPNNKIQTAVTATCQRNLAGDPTTAVLTIGVNDGLQPTGNLNRALFSGNHVSYNTWRDLACSQRFRDNAATRIQANFASTTISPVTITFDYWACVPGQTVASNPAGVYTDLIALTLRNDATTLATSSIPVNITAPARCSISGGPSNITFSYVAFGPANFQFTSFSADCTNSLPYTMNVSPAAGVVGGLRYELGLADTAGSASNIGPSTLNRVGSATGSRAHVINGAMVANQAGLLGAIVPQPHTLTITY